MHTRPLLDLPWEFRHEEQKDRVSVFRGKAEDVCLKVAGSMFSDRKEAGQEE